MRKRHSEMAAKQASQKAKSPRVFGQATETGENVPRRPVRPRLHQRSAHSPDADPRHAGVCRPARLDASRCKSEEVGSGAAQRQAREKLLDAARRREIDVVLVWRLDRWGRSVTDLLATLQELEHLGVGFVSLTEALDLTTPAGRAMAGLLAVFAEFEREILRERVRAGLAHAGATANALGRPIQPDSNAARCENCIVPVSAKPRSPAVCGSAAPRFAAFWPDLFPDVAPSTSESRAKMVVDVANLIRCSAEPSKKDACFGCSITADFAWLNHTITESSTARSNCWRTRLAAPVVALFPTGS